MLTINISEHLLILTLVLAYLVPFVNFNTTYICYFKKNN